MKDLTDVQRINWMESQKYLKTGIIYTGGRFRCAVIANQRTFEGKNIREALDMAIAANAVKSTTMKEKA